MIKEAVCRLLVSPESSQSCCVASIVVHSVYPTVSLEKRSCWRKHKHTHTAESLTLWRRHGVMYVFVHGAWCPWVPLDALFSPVTSFLLDKTVLLAIAETVTPPSPPLFFFYFSSATSTPWLTPGLTVISPDSRERFWVIFLLSRRPALAGFVVETEAKRRNGTVGAEFSQSMPALLLKSNNNLFFFFFVYVHRDQTATIDSGVTFFNHTLSLPLFPSVLHSSLHLSGFAQPLNFASCHI